MTTIQPSDDFALLFWDFTQRHFLFSAHSIFLLSGRRSAATMTPWTPFERTKCVTSWSLTRTTGFGQTLFHAEVCCAFTSSSSSLCEIVPAFPTSPAPAKRLSTCFITSLMETLRRRPALHGERILTWRSDKIGLLGEMLEDFKGCFFFFFFYYAMVLNADDILNFRWRDKSEDIRNSVSSIRPYSLENLYHYPIMFSVSAFLCGDFKTYPLASPTS